MASDRKRLKKLTKGLVQAALNGTAAPQLGGTFGLTGAQGISPATLGPGLIGSLGLVNSNPGVSATLEGGESPYVIPAEAGLDFTGNLEKAARKQVRKAAKRAAKKSLVAKAAKDPIKMLARLELLTKRLNPNDPRRLHAAAVVLGAKLRANGSGSVAKGVMELGSIDSAAEIANALGDVEAALGISGSAAPFDPGRIDARGQLQAIMAGTSPQQSLAGTQNSGALTAYRSPAAALAQTLKSSGLDTALAKAEAEVRAAESSGNSIRLSAAHQDLSVLKLKAAHRAEGI